MRLTVAAVGRLRSGAEQSLIDDYTARISGFGRAQGITAFETREIEAPKGLIGATRRVRECALLEAAAPAAARRVILDERGRDLSSQEFAAQIGRWRDDGAGEIAFFIGGADGHDPSFTAKADLLVAFGRATWPHMLVRAMLVEQIYRAMTILAGHPYHRS